jgi:O-antigen/teichoic acid export membrane protein
VAIGKVVGKALVWTSLESFALSGLSLISLLVFARLLSAEQFGVVAISLAIVQVLTVPVELLFHDALIQRSELEPEHVNSAFTVSVLLGIVLCGGCWLLADVVEALVGEPHLAPVLRWMSLSLIGTGFGSVLIAMQRRKLEFRALAVRSMLGRSGSAVVAITMAALGAGEWSLVAQQVLLVCLATLVLWLLAEERPRFQIVWEPLLQLLRYGVYSTLFQLLVIFTPRIFMIMVGAALGSESAGLLSIAFRGLDMLRDLLSGAVHQVMMPLFSRLKETAGALFDAYNRVVQFTCLITFPLFVGLAACAEEVVRIAFGEQWLPATPYFALIALLTLETFSRMFASTLLHAVGKPAAPSLELAAQVSYVVVGMLLVGDRSLPLAMTVWATRYVVSVPIDMWMLKRASGMPIGRQLRGAGTPLIAAALMGGAVLLLKTALLLPLAPALRLPLMVLAGFVSYVAAVAVLDRSLLQQLLSFAGQTLRPRA